MDEEGLMVVIFGITVLIICGIILIIKSGWVDWFIR